MIFRKVACVPECESARHCVLAGECPYARLFEPASVEGPSGLADPPRPFVFRANHLDGRTLRPGEPFHFDLNLFDTRSPAVSYLVLAFAQLARQGIGPGRGRAVLRAVSAVNSGERIFDGGSFVLDGDPTALVLNLEPGSTTVERLRVRFVTPTELKGGNGLIASPEFGVLASRVRDRVSTLRELYGDGPLPIDFRAFGERAARVRLAACRIQHVEVERRSGRTGQTHPLGGFVGEADYEGDLTEFVPYLHAARWTGVGRQTVWGKGELALQPLPPVQSHPPQEQQPENRRVNQRVE